MARPQKFPFRFFLLLVTIPALLVGLVLWILVGFVPDCAAEAAANDPACVAGE